MGIHHFRRADHLRVPEPHRRPDEPSPNERTFDSDPRRSVPMAFGYRPGSFRMVEVARDDRKVTYDIYAKTGMEPTDGTPDREDFLVGHMTTKTMEQIYREADRRGR